MGATGSSRSLFDFDSFEELQSPQAARIPVRTPGIAQLLTKRGTNDFKVRRALTPGGAVGYSFDETRISRVDEHHQFRS
jgi:hypothetical protein